MFLRFLLKDEQPRCRQKLKRNKSHGFGAMHLKVGDSGQFSIELGVDMLTSATDFYMVSEYYETTASMM